MDYTILSRGIRNNNTGKVLKREQFYTKKGNLNKRLNKILNVLEPSQLNKVVSKYEVFNQNNLYEILKNNVDYLNNIVYDESKKKFYDKKYLLSRTKDIKDRVLSQGKLFEKKDTKNYENDLRRELIKLDKKSGQITIDLTKINFNDFLKLAKNTIGNKKMLVEFGDKTIVLNDKVIDNLLKKGLEIVKLDDTEGSDNEFILDATKSGSFEFITFKDFQELREKPQGAFFKYYNNTHFDFSEFGIFKEEELLGNEYDDNCLYNSFKVLNMENSKLEQLKTFVLNRSIPLIKIKEVAKKLDIHISITRPKPKKGDLNNNETTHYNKNENLKHYKLGLLDSHYFAIKDIEITKYALENYEKIKDIENCNEIFRFHSRDKIYEKDKKRFTNSYHAIKILLDRKDILLKKLTYNNNIINTQFYDKAFEYDTLEYNELNYQLIDKNEEIEKDEKKKEIIPFKIFFDFETYTDSTKKHIPYLGCMKFENENNVRYFIGEDCAENMLKSLPKDQENILLIAHNCGYDFRFMAEKLYSVKPIFKGNGLMSATANYYINKKRINLTFKDSYKLITMPLRNFGKCFNLDCKKEIMPYDLYNKRNPLQNRFVLLDEFFQYVNEKDYEEVIRNCINYNCLYNLNYENVNEVQENQEDKYYVDIITYSLEYCKMDCIVLEKGYLKFRDYMLELTKLDIDYNLTIAGLANKYLIYQGVFENCYRLSGIPRHFIQKCVVGGRCMTNNNKKYKVSNGRLADFDAVSLYPSAMYRMEGILQGLPKILNNFNYDYLKNKDGFFIKIKILKVNKKRQFPLMSRINENTGVREFSNEQEGQYLYVDKTGLEDLINFHKIEFEIIQGYYYENGRNTKINEVIKNLFEGRLQKKKEKNPIQVCYKLLMNSAYGKTILKPIETDIEVIHEKNFEKFRTKKYNFIKEYTKIGKCYYCKMFKTIEDHFNMCYAGVEILSMSKRIMNEVMCLAEDKGYMMYYQDTDSIHIDYDEVAKLEIDFKEKYNRDLTGKQMGQLHIDFDLEGAVGEIYAKNSYFLGKKMYIDEIESINEKGEIINGFHIRMKGIPNKTIEYYCKENKISSLELYEKLYNHESINFDLTNGGTKCNFEYKSDMTIHTRSEFSRTIKI
jgi:hypothetical protein